MNAAVSITNHTHGMRRLNFYLRIPFSLVFCVLLSGALNYPSDFSLKQAPPHGVLPQTRN